MMRLLTLILVFLFAVPAFAVGAITRIDVVGVERIDEGMVRSLVPIQVGDAPNDQRLSDALRTLHASRFFSDVSLEVRGSVLVISVVEAPLVGEVVFEGMRAIREEQIADRLVVRPRTLFSPAAIRRDIETLKTGYRTLGYFRVQVEAKTILRPSGVKDVVFQVTEGRRSFIRQINFHGNDSFSDARLIDAIMSNQRRWWSVFQTMDTFHEERIIHDTEMLRQFYFNHGFLDFEVVSYTAKMDARGTGFHVDFFVREGQRYRVSSIAVESTIADLDTAGLEDEILLRVGRFYSEPLARRSIIQMSARVGEQGFAFVNIDVDRRPNRATGEVDVVFRISDGRAVTVNKINVRANTRTYDSIIRRNLAFGEQGVMSPVLFGQSEQRLMGLGYFDRVAIVPRPVPGVPDKVDIDVIVSERSTGQLSFGAGWSSINAGFIEAGIRENNFRGRGQVLGFNASFSEFQNTFSATFTEPHLFDRDLMGGVDVFYGQTRYRSVYGFDRDVLGGGPRIGWSYTDNLSHMIRFHARHERMVNVREELQENMGAFEHNVFRLSSTLTFRDQTIDFVNNTRRGYSISLTNTYAGFWGDKYFVRNDLALRQFFSFFEGAWQLGITADFGRIDALNNTVLNASDRFILGGDNMRGFEFGGIGARHANPALAAFSLGGNWRANGTVQLNFPIGIPQQFGVKGYVFYDWGTLGPPDLRNFDALHAAGMFDYSSRIRMSHGVGLLWNSPIGEINLSWAWQSSYEPFDRLQRFRFSIGNNF